MKRIAFFGILLAVLIVAGCAGPQTNSSPPGGNILSPPAQGFAASNPAPVGTPISFTEVVNESGQGNTAYSARLTLVEVLRGSAAMDKMKHDVPYYMVNIAPDREYLLAHFKYELTDTNPSGATHLVNRDPFELYRDGKAYPEDNNKMLGPTPDFYGKARKGDTVDGWIEFTVPKDAPAPLIVYGRTFAGNEGIWFKTA